jgi:hypothetical protein
MKKSKVHHVIVTTSDGDMFTVLVHTSHETYYRSAVVSEFLSNKVVLNKVTDTYYPMHSVVKFQILGGEYR